MFQIVRRTGPKKELPKIEIETVEYNHKPITGRICTFDTETDPFAQGRIVKPFCAGLYFTDTGEYLYFWGDDCILQFVNWLKEYKGPKLSIFVHNGGNFDFYFLIDFFDEDHSPFIINGRLVRIEILGHEFRDSYAMMPVALGEYDKDNIDYRCMEKGFRDVFKDTILSYMKRDCTALGELVTNWLDMFGNRLTMASVALPMLRARHGFETLNEYLDADLRPYYFGGRNQCFATGILTGDFKVYDINSSYPNVMRKFRHPISDLPAYKPKITDKSYFAHIRAWSLGALPKRNKDGSLSFPIGTHDFHACIHEINAGLETKTLKIIKVYSAIEFEQDSSFADFIDEFYSLRLIASENGDEIKKLFYKLVMNSSYGKFAQDPRKYENYLFNPSEIPTPFYCDGCYKNIREKRDASYCAECEAKETSPYGWYLHTSQTGVALYASPQKVTSRNFFNVATAASITSAARAELLRGIQAAERPVYCDTDSIICTNLDNSKYNVEFDDKKLGAWKLEASGNKVAIAGKKLYAVFNDNEAIKKASKGVKLSAEEIERVANGEVIEYASPVPKFALDGDHKFTTRTIRKTA